MLLCSKPNGSQFFFTLSESPELNGKATLFGRLVGDTIFNLLRMGELEIDSSTETPLYPPKIIDTEVVLNPFDDIVVRERDNKINSHNKETEKDSSAKNSSNNLKKKNTSLLSFEAEDEDEPILRRNVKKSEILPSAHVPVPVQAPQQAKSSLQFLQQMKSVQMRETQDKIKKIEEELGFRPPVVADSKPKVIAEKGVEKNLSALEKYKAKFAEKKRKIGSSSSSHDEMETLLLLNSFRQKIQKSDNDSAVVQPAQEIEDKKMDHLDICKLHGLLNCLSCQDTFNINLNAKDDDVDEKDWMMHKLVFDRREIEGKVRDDLRDLVVIDPREQANKLNKQK